MKPDRIQSLRDRAPDHLFVGDRVVKRDSVLAKIYRRREKERLKGIEAFTPQYYPGNTSVGMNRRKHMPSNLEKLRDIPDTDPVQLYSDRGILLKTDLGQPIVVTSISTAAPKRGRRGAKGGRRIRPSERQSELSGPRLCPDFVIAYRGKSKAEIRAEKAARRAEAELLRRKAAGTFL